MDSEQETHITTDLYTTGTIDYNQSTTTIGTIDWSKAGGAIGGPVYGGPVYSGPVYSNTIYTTTNTTYKPGTWSIMPPSTNSETVVLDHAGITLKDGARIVVEGQDLIERIQKIEERLAIINSNTELEKNWPELQEAAQNYRKLEAEFAKKQKIWNRLNTPLPKDNK